MHAHARLLLLLPSLMLNHTTIHTPTTVNDTATRHAILRNTQSRLQASHFFCANNTADVSAHQSYDVSPCLNTFGRRPFPLLLLPSLCTCVSVCPRVSVCVHIS